MNVDGSAYFFGGGGGMTNSDEAIIYSGRRDGRHHEGVALVLRKVAARSLIEYHPVSERISVKGETQHKAY